MDPQEANTGDRGAMAASMVGNCAWVTLDAEKISHILFCGLGQHIGHVGLLAAIAQAIEVAMGISE